MTKESRVVINLSDCQLSVEKISVLEKCSNFAITSAKIAYEDVIANVEAGFRILAVDPVEKIHSFQTQVVNLSQMHWEILFSNTQECKDKIFELRDQSTYIKIDSNPKVRVLKTTKELVTS